GERTHPAGPVTTCEMTRRNSLELGRVRRGTDVTVISSSTRKSLGLVGPELKRIVSGAVGIATRMVFAPAGFFRPKLVGSSPPRYRAFYAAPVPEPASY